MNTLNFESPAVQSYLTILQSIINRMASNSAGCKTWCITLVSAMIVIIADKGKPDYVWIGLVPIALFFFLDSYYLELERRFRGLYDEFVHKLHSHTVAVEDLFIVTPGAGSGKTLSSILKVSSSVSIWPFYGLLAVMLVIVRVLIL
jgi:hypothetical protein